MTLEDQVAAMKAQVEDIDTKVTAIQNAPAPVATVDLSAVTAKLDAILAQFQATPAPAPTPPG